MKIIGYGEDSLTLWALTQKLEYLLKKLSDPSKSEECTIFYRPSFGRRGGEKSSQFGEFDFILITLTTAYLGESKWWQSKEINANKLMIELSPSQEKRHQLFKEYIEAWPSQQGESRSESFKEFGLRDKKPTAPAGSILRQNLKFVISKIVGRDGIRKDIQNVLLVFYQESSKDKKSEISNNKTLNFRIVEIVIPQLNGLNDLPAGFIELGK